MGGGIKVGQELDVKATLPRQVSKGEFRAKRVIDTFIRSACSGSRTTDCRERERESNRSLWSIVKNRQVFEPTKPADARSLRKNLHTLMLPVCLNPSFITFLPQHGGCSTVRRRIRRIPERHGDETRARPGANNQ